MAKAKKNTKGSAKYQPTDQELAEIKKQLETAKAQRVAFKEALEQVNATRPAGKQLSEAVAYGLWPKEKRQGATTKKGKEDTSARLAGLLRRENTLKAQAKKAQEDLKSVQAEIEELWAKRHEETKELLSE